jgi:hypothetical protein
LTGRVKATSAYDGIVTLPEGRKTAPMFALELKWRASCRSRTRRRSHEHPAGRSPASAAVRAAHDSILSLGQSAPVRTHFASVVRQRPDDRAVRGKTKSAGQRKHLQSQAGFDLFADHPTTLRAGRHPAGCHLQCPKSDDRRRFPAKRPSLQTSAKPRISNHRRYVPRPDRQSILRCIIVAALPGATRLCRSQLRPFAPQHDADRHSPPPYRGYSGKHGAREPVL